MTRLIVLTIACLTTLLGVAGLSEAQANRVINVTALPLASCPSGTVNADGTDYNHDTLAFQCAIALLDPTIGGEIYVPAGTYYLLETLAVNDKPAAFRGEGQGITRLIWNATTGPGHHGITFESSSTVINDTLAVRSMSLIRALNPAGGVLPGAALRAAWPVPGWHGQYGIVTTVIHDVHIAADPINQGSWRFGIELINPTTARISDFNIHGFAWDTGVAGIQIHGTSATEGKPIGIQVRDGTITRFPRGIELKDKGEGLHVQNVSIQEATYGVEVRHAGQGTSISNSGMLTREAGILLVNALQFGISNNSIHQFQNVPFKGIDIQWDTAAAPVDAFREFRIIGNSIFSPTSGTQSTRHGIVVQGGTSDTNIEGNTTYNMNNGIWLSGPVSSVAVIGNINWNATTPVLDQGAPTNYVIHNQPPP